MSTDPSPPRRDARSQAGAALGGAELTAELAEQPRVVERLLRERGDAIADAAAGARGARVGHVVIAARGSSDNAARYGQHVLGRFCALPVALATPSLSTLYDAPPRLERTLVIGISQSGESPDVCAVVAGAREQGQPTIAITNAPDSPLAAAADVAIDIGAGPERSVAATKTYTASLAALAALTAELAESASLRAELDSIPAAMHDQLERGVGAAADELGEVDRCAIAGRGPNYATAFEAALKIKELTGIAAEPFSPADLMHGPVAVLGPRCPLIAVAAAGAALPSVLEAAQDARARSAPCVALTDAPGAFAHGDAIVPLIGVPEWLSPLVAILPAQALAAEIGARRGVAIDAPFGLNKVTRTL
jgi:glucosamine--fructose-6-phosphate aminotransferase (isomerizing)